VKRDLDAEPGRDLNCCITSPKSRGRSFNDSPRSAHTRLQRCGNAAIGVFWKCIRAARTVRWLWKMPTGHRGQTGCKTRGLRSSASISFSASMAQQDQAATATTTIRDGLLLRLSFSTLCHDTPMIYFPSLCLANFSLSASPALTTCTEGCSAHPTDARQWSSQRPDTFALPASAPAAQASPPQHRSWMTSTCADTLPCGRGDLARHHVLEPGRPQVGR